MKAASKTSVLAAILGTSIATQLGAAEHRLSADGLVVHFGIMSAEQALRADGHRDAHPANPPGGSQHLLFVIEDAKSGKRVSDAEVDVAVTDPKGQVERKRMLHTQGGGFPDYSELFVFSWSGKYAVQVVITPGAGGAPIRTRFTVDHSL